MATSAPGSAAATSSARSPILLGETPIADVVALRPLRCLVLPGPSFEPFLVDNPRVMYRMLQAQARRLRAANRWRS